MGYDTFYSVRVGNLSELAFQGSDEERGAAREKLKEIIRELVEIDRAAGGDAAEYVFDEYGGCSGEYLSQWDGNGMEEIFIELSLRYPEHLFSVYVDGETKEDFRKFTVQNGQAKWHDSTIVYDDGEEYVPKSAQGANPS